MVTLADALTILDSGDVAGAIVDCELAGAARLVMRLTEAGVPVVVQTSIALPPALEAHDGRLSVLMRPVDPRTVIDVLTDEIDNAKVHGTIKLGTGAKQV